MDEFVLTEMKRKRKTVRDRQLDTIDRKTESKRETEIYLDR